MKYMEKTKLSEEHTAMTTELIVSFKKILNDMMNDIIRTFPELEENLDADLYNLWKNVNDVDKSAERIFKYCCGVFPEHFLDILYQNKDIFSNSDSNLHFLPGIDYRFLMRENISENTRNTIWKYLQLLMFLTVSNNSSKESFGDTAELFKSLDTDEFKKKLEETMSEMKNLFTCTDASNSTINPDYLPSAEKIHKSMSDLMNGKLGSLAKEIADETVADLNINLGDASNIGDVFSNLLKDPSKLMGMIKTVGSKLDTKIKDGSIKESELLEEASELMKKMKETPGMENIQDIFSKMGLGNKGKINHGAMIATIDRNLKLVRQKERMQNRIGLSKQTISEPHSAKESLLVAEENAEKSLKSLLKEIETDKIFKAGQNAEKSSGSDKKREKKKGKKK